MSAEKKAKPTLGGTLVNIIRNPAQAIRDTEDRNIWLLAPLLLTITAIIVHIVVFYNQFDITWMHAQIESQAGEPLPDEAKRVIQPAILALGTSVMVLFMLPAACLGWTIWFWLVERFTTGSQANEFMDWYSLSAWSLVPLGLGSLVSIFYILIVGAEQVWINDTWFYSVNALITHYPSDHPASSMMSAASPFLVWMVWIAGVGHSVRSNRPRRKSMIIAALPVVIIYALGIFGAMDI